jgi:hypothetical protein
MKLVIADQELRGELITCFRRDAREAMNFLNVRLQAPREAAAELRSFYVDRLELDRAENGGEYVAGVHVGTSTLHFSPASPGAAPFYHFALLLPGNRFEPAHTWLAGRTQLLPEPNTGDTLFDFDNWNALASYCLDPVGNIVELIAHRGVAEASAERPFSGRELVGFSEVGLVVNNKPEAVTVLAREADLEVWDGEVDDPARLVFVGERGRTLILCTPGRGWLPTGRAAELHPIEITLAGTRDADIRLSGTPHRVRSRVRTT